MKHSDPRVERNQVECRWRFKAISLEVKTCSSRGKNKLHRARAGVIQNGKVIDSQLCVVNFQSLGLTNDKIRDQDSSFDLGCGRLMENEGQPGRERGNVSGKEEGSRRG